MMSPVGGSMPRISRRGTKSAEVPTAVGRGARAGKSETRAQAAAAVVHAQVQLEELRVNAAEICRLEEEVLALREHLDRLEAAVRATRERLVGSNAEEDGRTVARCFDAVARAAEAAAVTAEERRAIRYVRPLLEALQNLGENLRGNATKLLRCLQVDHVGLPRSPRDFIATLKLTAVVAPCLFGSTRREDWHVRGFGIGDPRSPLFAALCEEAARPRFSRTVRAR